MLRWLALCSLAFLLSSSWMACHNSPSLPTGELIILPDSPPSPEKSTETTIPQDATTPESADASDPQEQYVPEPPSPEKLAPESVVEITPEPRPEPQPEPMAEPLPELAPEAQPEPTPEPTPTSLTVLYIGDSQSSGTKFAQTMIDALRNPAKYCPQPRSQNNTVFSYTLVSSAARHWSELSGSSKDWLCAAALIYTNGTAPKNTDGPTICAGITNQSKSVFQRRIEVHKPNAFLIQLGANSIGFSESYVKSRIQRMLDQMPQSSLCFWVTPTYSPTSQLQNRRDMERWTREVFQQNTRVLCHILPSIDEISKQTTCNPFHTSDGIHMTTCGSQLWAQVILSKLCPLQKL